jgi:hypothetical protein
MLNLVVINLEELDTREQIKYLIDRMNINYPTKEFESVAIPIKTREGLIEDLYMAKWGAREDRGWTKVWLNPDNGCVIAFEDSQGQNFSEHFIQYLVSLESLSLNDLPVLNNTTEYISLDLVLEKISKSGMDSLSVDEKLFLDNYNK